MRTQGVQKVQGNYDHCPVTKSWQQELSPFKKANDLIAKNFKEYKFFNDIVKQTLVLVILGMLNPNLGYIWGVLLIIASQEFGHLLSKLKTVSVGFPYKAQFLG